MFRGHPVITHCDTSGRRRGGIAAGCCRRQRMGRGETGRWRSTSECAEMARSARSISTNVKGKVGPKEYKVPGGGGGDMGKVAPSSFPAPEAGRVVAVPQSEPEGAALYDLTVAETTWRRQSPIPSGTDPFVQLF
ncbi:hypothetical protein GW17_00028212 [Ensete ventricosum]|nr:hypothetical protein GW17_00028212 [Ensete ventricosum]